MVGPVPLWDSGLPRILTFLFGVWPLLSNEESLLINGNLSPDRQSREVKLRFGRASGCSHAQHLAGRVADMAVRC